MSKIILPGFPKTGTKTMTEALRILGYKVYDFDNHCYELVKDWIRIYEKGGTSEDFRRMYKDVDAASDLPASYYWQEMFEAFPDAKIILTTKSSDEAWLRSWLKQMKNGADNKLLRRMLLFTCTGYRFMKMIKLIGRVVFGTRWGPPWGVAPVENFELHKRRYREHTERVLQKAPKDKLLVYNLSEGWEPLCKFLGKEIPDVPFPYKNKEGTVLNEAAVSPMFVRMYLELQIFYAVVCVLLGLIIYGMLGIFYV